jgi:hypothetical protein
VSPILGIWASQNYSRYSITGSYESIATVTVGSGGAANVEFTSIPSTYTHLQIRAISRSTASTTNTGVKATFNSASTNYYALHQLYGDGSSAIAGANPASSYIVTGHQTGASASSNIFGTMVMDVLDYANTNKNKTVRTFTGYDANGSGLILFRSSLWMNTNAITSISFSSEAAGNIAQYSHFALYGIKGA